MELPSCNSYLIRLLYQEIPKVYPDLVLSQRSFEGQGWKALVLERLTDEEKTKHESEREAEKQKKLNDIGGFVRVTELMTAAKKPIIGHNMLLDLCYFYHYFLGNLPSSSKEFANNLLKEFPL